MTNWADRAECQYVGTELFYPNDGKINHHWSDPAKQVCAVCPVRPECLEAIMRIEGDEPSAEWRHGVWGGTTPPERARLAKDRREALEVAA
jgi:WhiB family transcriptional regulator, redox-sensing transcriptional regulator